MTRLLALGAFCTLLAQSALRQARRDRLSTARDLTPYADCAVFFLESTGAPRLLRSQECAVESAARYVVRTVVEKESNFYIIHLLMYLV